MPAREINPQQASFLSSLLLFEIRPAAESRVTKYILEHFDQKTYRGDKTFEFSVLQNISEVASGKNGTVEEIKAKQRVSGFNSIFAVASVPVAMKYYREFQKQMCDSCDDLFPLSKTSSPSSQSSRATKPGPNVTL